MKFPHMEKVSNPIRKQLVIPIIVMPLLYQRTYHPRSNSFLPSSLHFSFWHKLAGRNFASQFEIDLCLAKELFDVLCSSLASSYGRQR